MNTPIRVFHLMCLMMLLGCASRSDGVATIPDWSFVNKSSPPEVVEAIPEGWFQTSCGQSIGFLSGRAVYRDDKGNLLPILDLKVGRVESTGEEPVVLEISPEGKFSRRMNLSFSHSWRKKNGALHFEHYSEEVTLVFRALGCNDKTIVYNDQWNFTDVELECPRRLSNFGINPAAGGTAPAESLLRALDRRGSCVR